MDCQNYQDLQDIRPSDAHASLQLFLEDGDVPDPYYGGSDGFERVLDLVEARMKTVFANLAK